MKKTTLCIITLLCANVCWCQSPENVSSSGMIKYAEFLSKNQQFSASAEEYARIIAYFPTMGSKIDLFQAAFFMAEASTDYSWALSFIANLSGVGTASELPCLSQYYRGRILYRMQKYDASLQALELDSGCGEPYRSKAHFSRSLGFMQKWDWASASGEIKKINSNFMSSSEMLAVNAAIAKGAATHYKSPKVAGFLSALLPGSGYIYSSQPKSGFAAFITTGLLAWGATSAFNKKENGVGVLLGVIGTGWYFGGVYGSAQAAKRCNTYRIGEIVEPLENISGGLAN